MVSIQNLRKLAVSETLKQVTYINFCASFLQRRQKNMTTFQRSHKKQLTWCDLLPVLIKQVTATQLVDLSIHAYHAIYRTYSRSNWEVKKKLLFWNNGFIFSKQPLSSASCWYRSLFHSEWHLLTSCTGVPQTFKRNYLNESTRSLQSHDIIYVFPNCFKAKWC